MLRMTVCVSTLLAVSSASAQTTGDQNDPNMGITVTWTRPTLNLAACTATDANVTLTAKLTSAVLPLTTPTFFAWFKDGDTAVCTGAPTDAEKLGSKTFNAGDTFLAGTGTVSIPADLDSAPTLTRKGVLDRESACGTTGIATKKVKLCMGLDTGGTAGNVETGEPQGWGLFTIDTLPPPAPEAPQVTPQDNALQVTGRVVAATDSSTQTDDIASWKVVARPEPADATLAAQPPNEWDPATITTATATSTGTSGQMTVTAVNGTAYQVAVYAIDATDNQSPASPVGTGTPQQECDFMECYPEGALEPGFCGAAPDTLWAVVAVLSFRRRRLVRL